MMGLLAVYAFIKPYKMFYVNLLESAVLTNMLLLLLIASTNDFKVIIPSAYQCFAHHRLAS